MPSWMILTPMGRGGDVPNAVFSATAMQFLNRIIDPGGARKVLYAELIDGLLADGIWGKLDALYIMAAPRVETANTNLVSPSYTLQPGGSGGAQPLFTADRGYTGVSANFTILDTQFRPSSSPAAGGLFAQTSNHISVYCLTDRGAAAGVNSALMGATDGTATIQVVPKFGDGLAYFDANEDVAATVASNVTNGFWVATRTDDVTVFGYRNGSTTPMASLVRPSTALCTLRICLLERDAGLWCDDEICAASLGSGLSAAEQALLAGRINRFMTVLGINTY